MADLCARRAETGCSGFTPPGRETYVCDKPCRLAMTSQGLVPMWPEHSQEWAVPQGDPIPFRHPVTGAWVPAPPTTDDDQ